MPGFVKAGPVLLLLACLGAGSASAAPAYRSKDDGFALTLPAGCEPRAVPNLRLDIIGWQRTTDHSVAGAVWRLNHQVFERYGGSPYNAAEFLRATHRCRRRVCKTTPVRRRHQGRDGELAFYELSDPSVPSDRGVLSGVMRLGGELYRVQAINYDPGGPERAELLKALGTARLAGPGVLAIAIPQNGPADASDWGLSFSGESDASLEQDTRSERGVEISAARRPRPNVLQVSPRPASETFPAIPLLPARVPVPDGDAAYEEFDESKLHDPIPDLIKLLSSRSARMRARAADVLGQRGEPAAEAVPALTAALDDPDGRVRASAALALGNIGPKARGAVSKISALASDRNPDVRLSAETALQLLNAAR